MGPEIMYGRKRQLTNTANATLYLMKLEEGGIQEPIFEPVAARIRKIESKI
jgi:hypothetical protein